MSEYNTTDVVQRAKDAAQRFYSITDDFQTVSADDADYTNGKQWTVAAEQERGQRPKPVINTAPTYIRRVQDFYKTRESYIKVAAVDSGADKSLANVFQGLINNIMRDSMGYQILDDNFYSMLARGMGFCRVDAEWDGKSFNKKLVVKEIENPESVFFDLDTEDKDRSDMTMGGWIYDVCKKEFEKQYPEAYCQSFPKFNPENQSSVKDVVTLCKYYERTVKTDKLVSFLNPLTNELEYKLKSEMDSEDMVQLAIQWGTKDLYKYLSNTGKILAERDYDKTEIKWYICSDTEVLKNGDWPGEYIPLIPMLGPKYKVDGSIYYSSLIRWAKESGRLKNYLVGNTLENLALKPLAPFMMEADQVEGHEEDYGLANISPQPYLLYNKIDNGDGSYTNQPPIQIPSPDVPAGLVAATQMVDEDAKRTMGILDGAFGAVGKDDSGKAILARSDEALNNTNVFIECRAFSTQLLGRILGDLIPKYYDTERTVRIIGEDGKEDVMKINAQNPDGKFLDIKNANFDVYIETGPSASSRRKESMEYLVTVGNMLSEQFRDAMANDLVKLSDVQGSDKLAEKFQKIQNPALYADEEEKTQEQLQAEVAQLSQQLQQSQQLNEEYQDVIMAEREKAQQRMEEAKLKVSADLRKEAMKQEGETMRQEMSDQTDIKESEIQAQSRKEVELIKQSMNDLASKMDMIITAITPQKSET